MILHRISELQLVGFREQSLANDYIQKIGTKNMLGLYEEHKEIFLIPDKLQYGG